jgi:hypothetical protein
MLGANSTMTPNQSLLTAGPGADSFGFYELSTSYRRFEFHKRRQLFIGQHNEAVSATAMRVSNEHPSPAGIRG